MINVLPINVSSDSVQKEIGILLSLLLPHNGGLPRVEVLIALVLTQSSDFVDTMRSVGRQTDIVVLLLASIEVRIGLVEVVDRASLV